MKQGAALLISASLALMGCSKTRSAGSDIPPEEIHRANPVQFTAASISQGQRVYLSLDCGVCHGMAGDGKGVVAKDMGVDIHIHNWHESGGLQGYADGALFYIMTKGKQRMPGYEKMVSTEQSWAMINYIRSLSSPTRVGQLASN